MSFTQLYERYQKGIRSVHLSAQVSPKTGETQYDFEEQTLLNHAYYGRNLIKWLGYGTRLVPSDFLRNIPGISRSTLRFHNTNLSKIVQNCYQASRWMSNATLLGRSLD